VLYFLPKFYKPTAECFHQASALGALSCAAADLLESEHNSTAALAQPQACNKFTTYKLRHVDISL
jgi:hypothetical protein